MVLGRAAVLGTAGLGCGAASHVAGGGHLPGGAALAVLLGVSIAVATLWLRTWATTTRLVLAVVLAQTGWHLVLSLLAGHAGDTPVATATTQPPAPLPATFGEGRRTGSLHEVYAAMVPPAPAPAPTGSGDGLVAHQVAHVVDQGPLMVLAHAAGAVLLGVFLARGEAALWRLVSLVAATLERALVAGVLCAAGPLGTPRCGACVVRASQVLHPSCPARSAPRRRGPPFLLAA